jgi:hypothetical protein
VFEDAYVDTGIYVLATKKKQIIKGCQFDKKFRITKIDNLEFNQIRLEDIKPPDYKIIISKGVQSIHSKIHKKPITELGDISISAQGLSASRFKLYSKKEAQTLPFLLLVDLNCIAKKRHKHFRFYTKGKVTGIT